MIIGPNTVTERTEGTARLRRRQVGEIPRGEFGAVEFIYISVFLWFLVQELGVLVNLEQYG